MINEMAVAYWQGQKLAAAVVERLCQGPQAFADSAAGQARLQELAITRPRQVRIVAAATDGGRPPKERCWGV